jgi:hypothetical protein
MSKFDHLRPSTIGKPYPKAWIIGKTLAEIDAPVKKLRGAYKDKTK